MRGFILPALLILSPAPPSQIPGKRHFGTKAYVEYVEGNLPLVIAAPHGGRRIPPGIPPRTYGVRTRDRRTQALAREIARELFLLTGRHAHLVISHLDRSRLDPNRDIVEAAQGNKEAEKAWREFHAFITQARAWVSLQWKRGLFLDIHGHGHKIQRIELGYLLKASDLGKSDSTLRGSSYRDRSSIRSLASLPNQDFPSLLRGRTSLGGLLEGLKVRSVPSPGEPNPGSQPYFSGGYDTRRHGSRNGGSVDAIQLEHPWSLRQTRDHRNPYARKLAQALLGYMRIHYGMDLKGGPRLRLVPTTSLMSEAGGIVKLRLVRSRKGNRPLSVTLVPEGTASPGQDYSLPPKVLTIPAGRTEVSFELRAIQDNKREGPEFLRLRLKGGPEIIGTNKVEVLLQDDDQAPSEQAHWSFERVETGGTILDDSGSGNDLTLHPRTRPPSLVAGGPNGFSLALDGKSQYGRALVGSPGGSFHLGLSFLLVRRPANEVFLLGWGVPGKDNSLSLSVLPGSGFLRSDLRFGAAEVARDALDVETDLADGKWHRLDLQSEEGGWVRVWIDGRRERSMSLGGKGFAPKGSLCLGSASDLRNTGFFPGFIDEVQLGPPLPDAAIEAWTPWASARPFGTSCQGPGPNPLLRPWGVPRPYAPFQLRVERAGPKLPLLLLLGLSRASWKGVPLPLDLGLIGSPGCKLFISAELFLAQQTDAKGGALLPLLFPLGPPLLGAKVFGQAFLLVPGSTGLSLQGTNALELLLGY